MARTHAVDYAAVPGMDEAAAFLLKSVEIVAGHGRFYELVDLGTENTLFPEGSLKHVLPY